MSLPERSYHVKDLFAAAYDVLLDIAEDEDVADEDRIQAAEVILLNPPVLDLGGDGLPSHLLNLNRDDDRDQYVGN